LQILKESLLVIFCLSVYFSFLLFGMIFAARRQGLEHTDASRKEAESKEAGGNKCKKITKKVFFFLVIQINFVNLCSV